MYRIVATDLDGTLLKNDKTISPFTESELKRINDLGVIFLPSTGRTHVEIPEPVRKLPFLRYALCCNGGAVYDYELEKYIFETTIDLSLGLEVLHFLKDYPVCPSFVINGKRYVQGDETDHIPEEILRIMAKGILFNCTGLYELETKVKELNSGIQKMMIYPNKPEYRDEVMAVLSKQFPQLEVSSSGPSYIEVNAKGIDKGVALHKFCDLLNIDIKDTMVFGDAENDIAMLKVAGLSVVMDNGTDKAKEYADQICPSNEDDGVAKTLQEYIY